MYKCNFPGCKKECKTVQALLAHKRLKHGITGAAVYAETENVQTIEQTTEHVLSGNFFEDPREKLLRAEQVVLRNEIVKIKAQILESRTLQRDVEDLKKGRDDSEEEKSGPSLPEPPTLPLPPLAEIIKEKVSSFNKRQLFR